MWLPLPIVDDGVCIRSRPDVLAYITSEANFCAGDRSDRSPCQGYLCKKYLKFSYLKLFSNLT